MARKTGSLQATRLADNRNAGNRWLERQAVHRQPGRQATGSHKDRQFTGIQAGRQQVARQQVDIKTGSSQATRQAGNRWP